MGEWSFLIKALISALGQRHNNAKYDIDLLYAIFGSAEICDLHMSSNYLFLIKYLIF